MSHSSATRPGVFGERADFVVATDHVEDVDVVRRRRLGQAFARRRQVEARLERGKAREIEVAIAPLDRLHRIEAMGLERLDQFVLEGIEPARRAEGAVAEMAAGAAGDLAELGGGEPAELIAVELSVGGESDMVDIEVEAHADGVGGDQEIDIARLEDLDLGIARARRQRAEDDGGAAALAADQLGDGIDLVGREGDHGGAARQAGDLFRAGKGEHRHARPRHHVDAGDKLLDDPAHRRGAEEQRLLAAAEVQHAIGEDVAALEIAGELDLVDGEEGDIGLRRHRFNGADTEARRRRQDLLLAGDQGDLIGTDALGDAVVDLAGEKPERQTDHPGGVAKHPLDGEMGLAGVGRSEYGDHIALAEGRAHTGLRRKIHEECGLAPGAARSSVP